MEFALRDRDDGQIELVRYEPVVVGTFVDRDTANNIIRLLSQEEIQRQSPLFTVSVEDNVAEPAPDPEPVVAVVPPPAPEVPAPGTAIVAAPPSDLDALFERIRNGEKIADIAEDVGMSMLSLRSKWANHRRYLKAVVNPDEKARCAMCDREFTVSAISPDRCARCAHD